MEGSDNSLGLLMNGTNEDDFQNARKQEAACYLLYSLGRKKPFRENTSYRNPSGGHALLESRLEIVDENICISLNRYLVLSGKFGRYTPYGSSVVFAEYFLAKHSALSVEDASTIS